MQITQYWMVHTPGTSTTTMHSTKEKASAEAERLAALKPGTVFTVLGVYDAFAVQQPLPTRVKIIY